MNDESRLQRSEGFRGKEPRAAASAALPWAVMRQAVGLKEGGPPHCTRLWVTWGGDKVRRPKSEGRKKSEVRSPKSESPRQGASARAGRAPPAHPGQRRCGATTGSGAREKGSRVSARLGVAQRGASLFVTQSRVQWWSTPWSSPPALNQEKPSRNWTTTPPRFRSINPQPSVTEQLPPQERVSEKPFHCRRRRENAGISLVFETD